MDALELLAWMVARGYLDVKVVVPCDAKQRPIAGVAIFHEKGGVIEDRIGDRIAFARSINETEFGWRHNWESFHVFTTWEGSAAHVEAEDASFQTLWADRSKRAIVFDVPTAVRDELLKFLPTDDCLPRRIEEEETPTDLTEDSPAAPDTADAKPLTRDPRRIIWSFIHLAPRLPNGGERVGEATSAVIPWPHQVRAFHRLYDHWPPKLLIADEVGLGKTIQAGMLLRQAWLSGRAGRILVLAPKAVLSQWQIELREKFNLNWPIYDGQKLSWYPSPGFRGEKTRAVERTEWHREPFLLVSSQLMRRRDRVRELCEDAGPWGLIILDEAHHARRHGGGTGNDDRPNQLLRLMQRLIEKTAGLVMLTATPMQVSPVEILFETFVGRLQPILSRLPKAISDLALSRAAEREQRKSNLIDALDREAEEIKTGGFDLDEITDADLEEPLRPESPYGLPDLARILRRPQLLPPGIAVTPTGKKDFSYMQPGMERPVRVTADPDFFDAHSDSAEIWSPGSPLFPYEQSESPLSDVTLDEFHKAIE